MRFSVPRSLSPSPVRKSRTPRRSCTFRAPSVSSDSDSSPGSSSDSESFLSDSESELPTPLPKPKRPQQSPDELRYIEDTLASIRLRITHHDPYEEWEKETKRDAFRTARNTHAKLKREQHAQQDQKRVHDMQRLDAYKQALLQETEAQYKALQVKSLAEEQKLKTRWQERDKRQKERIESVIKFEEDRRKAVLEAERKAKEEDEKRKKAEEEAKRMEEEKKKNEELQQRLQKEKEELERQQRELAEMETLEKEKLESSGRDAIGLNLPLEDWKQARDTLKRLKSGPLKIVKADKNLKSQWNKLRREIIPKVGQLTNDSNQIMRVSQDIADLFRSPTCSTPEIYFSALSSLSKALLLQAETEVTAEKRSAIPLAHVAANLLQGLDGFSEILWAKLVQRTGGWPIPIVPPREPDVDYNKLSGLREDESISDFTARVAGIMRVYFHILTAPVNSPLDPPFRVTRYWIYFARMLSDRQLLERGPVGPELLATALDVGGNEARTLFGHQWHKMMELLYTGLTSESAQPFGGQSPEGNAARVRALLEVEKVMGS